MALHVGSAALNEFASNRDERVRDGFCDDLAGQVFVSMRCACKYRVEVGPRFGVLVQACHCNSCRCLDSHASRHWPGRLRAAAAPRLPWQGSWAEELFGAGPVQLGGRRDRTLRVGGINAPAGAFGGVGFNWQKAEPSIITS